MVFGGIIHHIGEVEVLSRLKLRVTVPVEMAREAQLGDSIAVNGVCLTVVSKTETTFDFDLSEETVNRTTLSNAPKRAHIEPALKLSDAVGGHVVSGHVHGVGFFESLDSVTGNLIIRLPLETFYRRPLFKDSIAIDGVSLTVAELVDADKIRIALIPHTIKLTLFASMVAGDKVNIEFNAATTSTDPAARGAEKDDVAWMRAAIVEGEKGRFTAPPNPWVGAVLVDPWNNFIEAGHHVRPGEPHAERNIKAPMQGATLYVTLEPCAHYGRTPPCVEYLLETRPQRVVIGTLDPDPRVRGKGVAALRAAGIDVTVGVAEDEVQFSLRAYLWHRTSSGKPYVVCKLALSQDNCYAYRSDCAESRGWITGVAARQHAHLERASSQKLIVGKNTFTMDKPQLTVRFGIAVDHQPEAVVSTRELKWLEADNNALQVLVEGGPELEEDLLRRGVVHEFLLYRSTKMLGLSGVRWTPSFANHEWRLVETKTFEDGDTVQRFLLRGNNAGLPAASGAAASNAAAAAADSSVTSPLAKPRVKTAFSDDISHQELDDATRAEEDRTVRFDSLRTAIAALQRGDLIVVMDDANRENEGDLMILADRITLRNMKFLLAHTTGIVCATITQTRANQLGLPLMVSHDKNADPHRTKFTVTVDAAVGVTTGVSASDRMKTLSLLASPTASQRDFNRPGHIFPLVAAPGGLLQRRGHTEAGVELARMAGMVNPVMVISELYDSATGKMMSRAQCRQLGFPMITIDTILGGEGSPLWASLPMQQHPGNDWKLSVIAGNKIIARLPSDDSDESATLTRVKKNIAVRIHSECFTGDVLGSSLCDCGNQLHAALEYIGTNPEGGFVIFPAEHEGRGIGLEEKVKVYALQREHGMDTFAANQALGHPEDARDFSGVVFALQHIGVRPATHHVTLLTENPGKIKVLTDAGYSVTSRALLCNGTPHNTKYLTDKREYFSSLRAASGVVAPTASAVIVPSSLGASTEQRPRATVPEGDDASLTQQSKLMKQAPKHIDVSGEDISYLQGWEVCVVQAEWHRHVSDVLVDNIRDNLRHYGITKVHREFAPGSFELPRVIQHLSKSKYRRRNVVFVAVGVLVKGDTDHYDLVARETTANILRLQLDEELWIVNAVLGCHNMAQVEERCYPESDKCVGPHMAQAVARLALTARN